MSSHIEVTKPSFKISFYLSEEKSSTAQEGMEDGSSRGKGKPVTPGQRSVQCRVTDLATAETFIGKNPHFFVNVFLTTESGYNHVTRSERFQIEEDGRAVVKL